MELHLYTHFSLLMSYFNFLGIHKNRATRGQEMIKVTRWWDVGRKMAGCGEKDGGTGGEMGIT